MEAEPFSAKRGSPSISCRLAPGRRGAAHRAGRLVPAHQGEVDGGAVLDGLVDAHECGGGCEAVARPPWAGADELPLAAARVRQPRPGFVSDGWAIRVHESERIGSLKFARCIAAPE
jgi:hypothetical protein